MGQLLDLALHRLDHLGVVMAGVEYADTADKVQVAAAVDIPQLGTTGAGRHQWVGGGDAAWHIFVAPGEQTLVFAKGWVHLDLQGNQWDWVGLKDKNCLG
ncbi:hypothetical protein D3C80_1226110 [compost metagenome]